MSFAFGNTQATTAPASGFSFGAPAAASTAPASTGFSFGGASTAPAPAPASTGFSFGGATAAPTAAPNTGFSFGGATAAPTAAPASTGFSFGGATAAPTAAPASTGFSFGATAAPTAAPASTGFSFGGATAAPTAAPASTGFSFGGASTAPASTGFSFGGSTAAPASTGFSFGGAPANTPNPAAPAGTNPLLAGVMSSGAIPVPFHAAAVQDPILTRMNFISSQYDYTSKANSFQTILYNRVPSSMHSKLVKPPHANDKLWSAGIAENPDPANLVPCLIVGVPDLIARVNEQYKALKKHDEILVEVNDQVKNMKAACTKLQNDSEKILSTQKLIDLRFMKALNKLTIYRSQMFPLMETEQDYLNKLKSIQSELCKSNNNYISKIQELQNVLEINGQDTKEAADIPDLDAEQVQSFVHVLNQQREFILQLTQTIQTDKQYIEEIKQQNAAK